MIIDDRVLHDRSAILAAVGHHPFARHALGRATPAHAYRRDGAVLWLIPPAYGPAGCAIGPAESALEICVALAADGILQPGQPLHLPRHDRSLLVDRLAVAEHSDWDFHWTDTAPPEQPDEQPVVRLTDADQPALAALVQESFPSSTSRPGDPRVVDWYGIRAGDRLVACGADRSQGDIGFLAGLTVAPDQRGRGLGASLTAGMTRALLARHDMVGLGVYTHNVGAARLYRRLGYTTTLPLSTIRLA
ncbi:GNAT family N-acetyltransferase [Micromonospora sp. NBC_00821]|uniref:GNAT family N-acetyltransferase n=1 Tax=Micromonospora sp. NBC_00821 TaxID=2975977 RepID=UPI002ED4F947|nr:GNAT family N-acetyltransferase [Micromonospora sp. NBC_00821]